MKVVLVCMLSLELISSQGIAQTSAEADRLQPFIKQLDAAAQALAGCDSCPSFTIGVVNKSGLVWTSSYGYADVAKKRAATASTVYRIGSITKQFTAVMLLQLVQAGTVRLSDPVETYVPEIRTVQGAFPTATVTLLQLATHTAGLASEPDDPAHYATGPLASWEATLIAALSHTHYLYEPGTRYSYSNVGYATLGLALSRAARRPFSDYLRERILQPLGMTHSALELSPALRVDLATGYVTGKGVPDPAIPEQEHAGRGYKVPNGALYSTVGDLARFMAFEMLAGPETVLARNAIQENYDRLVVGTSSFDAGYGIGYEIKRVGSQVFLGHTGVVSGYVSVAYFDRLRSEGIVILHNGMDGQGMGRLADVFFRRLDGEPPGRPPAP